MTLIKKIVDTTLVFVLPPILTIMYVGCNSKTENPSNYIQTDPQKKLELSAFGTANRNKTEHPEFGGQYLDSTEQAHYDSVLNYLIKKAE